MNSLYFDPVMDDDARRKSLYEGQLFVYTASPSAMELVRFARELVEDAFSGQDPELAQHHMPVEQYAALLADLKPKFIHHPRSKECLQGILRELGCDLSKTYFDVPRMRTSTSENYLTSGIAYAFHPHRDTWYSAPMCQINWWLPIYPIRPDNAMAFHPRYFREGVPNDSDRFNYYEWNANQRRNAAQHVKSDTRWQPHASVPLELEPDIRLLPEVGGMILFSAAHMHSTVSNSTGRTRFSIDFRTVHLDDVEGFRGAPNVDSDCTGTSMGDYLRASDLAKIAADLVAAYEPGPTATADRRPSSTAAVASAGHTA